MSTAGEDSGRVEVRLVSGGTIPDWSQVTSDHAAQALGDILEAFGVEKCWTGMEASENQVRRAVLDFYGASGHAPSLDQLAALTGLAVDDLRPMLRKLKARDLVVLDESGERIIGSYPFTERDTGHRVRLGDKTLNAMCAIDALGAGAMYARDITVDSACRECGAPIHVETRDNGAEVAAAAPEDAVVWSGIRLADGCAADNLCTVIAFFCSDRHLVAWRDANHPEIKGYRLSIEEAIQTGKAIFVPMLGSGSKDEG